MPPSCWDLIGYTTTIQQSIGRRQPAHSTDVHSPVLQITTSRTDRLFCLNTHAYLKESMQDHGLSKNTIAFKPYAKSEYPEQYFHQYPDIFIEDGFDKLPPHRVWDHCNELDKDFVPTVRSTPSLLMNRRLLIPSSRRTPGQAEFITLTL